MTAYSHLLDCYWVKGNRVYRTIGIITDPAIVIEDVVLGHRETHVVSSRNFAEYQQLAPQSPEARNGMVRFIPFEK